VLSAISQLGSLPLYRHLYQRLQNGHVLQIVTRLVDGRFRDEGRMLGTRIIQQSPKSLPADGAPADMLVAIAP
jgi:hypothetical protein